jgi:hypothetical protein
MYTTQIVLGKFEIRHGDDIIAVPDALEDKFEAHLKACLPPWKLFSDSDLEQRRHEACVEWLADHS